MTTIQVTLSDELKAVVEREVAEGGFDSPDAYLQSLVREAQRRRAERESDAKLVESPDVEEPGDADHMASLAVAVEEMKAGKGRPIEAMFAEMEARLAAVKAKRHG